MHDCLSTVRIAFFCFCFSATLYQQWIDLFGRLNFSCQNSYPANTFTSISRMNKNTNEQDGSQCFRSLLDLWQRNQNRNFGQWSFKSKSKAVQKKQPKSHISETPKRYQKLRRKYMTRITSSKDIMIQVREICYQTKKLVLIRNKLNFELRS